MRYVIFLITAIIVFVLAGTYLSEYQGTVTIELESGQYQMALTFFVIALVLTVVTLCLVIWLLWTIVRLPARIKRLGKRNKKLKMTNLLQKGMLEMSRGHWKQAEKILVKGAKMADKNKVDPSLFLVTAAEAAQNLGAADRRDLYLIKARQLEADGINVNDTKIAEARLHLKENEPEKALALLKDISLATVEETVYELRLEAQMQTGRFYDAFESVLALKKYTKNKTKYHNLLNQIIASLFLKGNTTIEQGKYVWNHLPKEIKNQHDVVLNYVTFLLGHQQDDQAESILATKVKQNYEQPYINAYTQLELGSSAIKLNKIKKWLQFKPEDAYLNYGAAKFSFESESFGEAKDYALKSISITELPETYAILGDIESQLGNLEGAAKAYQKSCSIAYAKKSKSKEGELLVLGEQNYLADETK